MSDPVTSHAVPPPVRDRPTIFGQEDRVKVVGLRRSFRDDAYSLLLEASWTRIIVGFVAVILVTHLGFALLYSVSGGIAGVRPGMFRDYFFFSVQTLGTIGYGQMYPTSDAAEMLVFVESFLGLFLTALTTGLVFSKFSLPLARVMFSQNAVISSVDGVPTLQFRTANARANHVVAAEANVALVRWEETSEGKALYRMHELALVRGKSPAFRNTWLLMHKITPQSPLHGLTPEQAIELDLEIAVTLVGIDGTTSQTIHANHSYVAQDLRFSSRFADMLSDTPGGGFQVDYTKFDVVEPA